MPDQKQAQPTAGNAARTLDPELSRQLIALGFDPKAPIFASHDWSNHTDIHRKLFDAGRPGPVILKFGSTDWDRPTHEEREASTWTANVLVELVTALFETDTQADDRSRKVPPFYIRGFLTDTATDSPPDAPRVHAFVEQHDGEEMPSKTAYFQLVDKPSPPDPDAVLVFGEGIPRACQSSII
jgi:hypothetical protein